VKITLAQLEALVWVIRLGTGQEAALQLNLTQPTVSLRLRDLSEALGKTLFYRDGRRLVPTTDALGIFDRACLILEEAGKIVHASSQDEFSGVVRMGMCEAVALAGLPILLDNLTRRYPDLRLNVAIGNSVNLQHDLYERTLDLVLGIDLYEEDRVRTMPLGIQEAAWVASPRHRLPNLVTPSDIIHLPIITNPQPSAMFRQTMNWFHSMRLEPQVISISYSISAIAHFVESGIGLAVLPLKLVETEGKNGALVALRCNPELDHSHLSIAYRTNDWCPAVGVVIEASKKMLECLDWLKNTVIHDA